MKNFSCRWGASPPPHLICKYEGRRELWHFYHRMVGPNLIANERIESHSDKSKRIVRRNGSCFFFCLWKIQRNYLMSWSFVVNLLCVPFPNLYVILLTAKEVVCLSVFFASRVKKKRWMRKSMQWSSRCPPRSQSDECLLRWPCSPEKHFENRNENSGYVSTGSSSQRVKRRKEITCCVSKYSL